VAQNQAAGRPAGAVKSEGQGLAAVGIVDHHAGGVGGVGKVQDRGGVTGRAQPAARKVVGPDPALGEGLGPDAGAPDGWGVVWLVFVEGPVDFREVDGWEWCWTRGTTVSRRQALAHLYSPALLRRADDLTPDAPNGVLAVNTMGASTELQPARSAVNPKLVGQAAHVTARALVVFRYAQMVCTWAALRVPMASRLGYLWGLGLVAEAVGVGSVLGAPRKSEVAAARPRQAAR
jgi:hypothetical protein